MLTLLHPGVRTLDVVEYLIPNGGMLDVSYTHGYVKAGLRSLSLSFQRKAWLSWLGSAKLLFMAFQETGLLSALHVKDHKAPLGLAQFIMLCQSSQIVLSIILNHKSSR